MRLLLIRKIFVPFTERNIVAVYIIVGETVPRSNYWRLFTQILQVITQRFFFLLSFWRTHVLFWGHWYPCFGFPVMSPLGFKSRVDLPYSLFAEVNVMYIPWDPPLVLHLSTLWWPARCWSCPHILLQRWGCRDSNSCSQNICEPDALPTELNRDRRWLHNLIPQQALPFHDSISNDFYFAFATAPQCVHDTALKWMFKTIWFDYRLKWQSFPHCEENIEREGVW